MTQEIPAQGSRAESRIRARRTPVVGQVSVLSKTLGTLMSYDLRLDNASRTGVLLVTRRPLRLPYHAHTLVELTIDPRGEFLERPVACLGRVVRAQAQADAGFQIGVHLIMMETRDEVNWSKVLTKLNEEPALLLAGDEPLRLVA